MTRGSREPSRRDLILRMLRKGANPNAGLEAAAITGDAELLQLLLEQGANLKCLKEPGRAVHMAVSNGGSVEAIRMLLEGGAPADEPINDQTPLIAAARRNGAAMVTAVPIAQLLLEHGANVNARRNTGTTALIEAAWNNNLPLAQLLLEYGADPTIRDHNGTALEVAHRFGYGAMAALLEAA